MKRFIYVMLAGAVATTAFGQASSSHSGTNSPYSQFGLGELSEQAGGVGRGMNGLGIAYREHNQVNHLNPASYSGIDSLTFIFDVGMSGQLTNFKENGKRLNAQSANFDYVVGGLRFARHLGVAFGVLPYSNVGYNYSTSERIGQVGTAIYSSTYKGSGGIHEVFIGAGWEPFKGVSLGVNGGYLWGSYDRSVVNSYSESSTALSKYYSADVRNYKLDFGIQLTTKLNAKDQLTLGATYGLGHKIGGKPTCLIVATNSTTAISDTTSYPRDGHLDLEIPTTIGAGLMWNHDGRIKVGADYSLQKWADTHVLEYVSSNNVADYKATKGLFNDLHKVTLGTEICPNENGRRYLARVRYRAGVSYATPYLKINGQDGPKELSASVGFGFPFFNPWDKRSSILNITAQWVRRDSKQFITENTFRINVGITINERWFDKWKVE